MSQPRLLSLFCGTVSDAGWRAAGFHVTGVDHKPQPRHSCDVFILADALDYFWAHGHEYDCVIASPPCQHYSGASKLAGIHRKKYPDLIADTRNALDLIDRPYVIENVAGAPLQNTLMLCGSQFGLKVYRHRFFESNVLLFAPNHYPHDDQTPPAGMGISPKGFISICAGGIYGVSTVMRRTAMGVDRYVTNYELSQAYPPAYAEYLGRQLIRYCERVHV
jgi:DNA (cytosine-5)-methyltransferase 1